MKFLSKNTPISYFQEYVEYTQGTTKRKADDEIVDEFMKPKKSKPTKPRKTNLVKIKEEKEKLKILKTTFGGKSKMTTHPNAKACNLRGKRGLIWWFCISIVGCRLP